MEMALEAQRAIGTNEDFPVYYDMHAEVLALVDRFDEACSAIDARSMRRKAAASLIGTRSCTGGAPSFSGGTRAIRSRKRAQTSLPPSSWPGRRTPARWNSGRR